MDKVFALLEHQYGFHHNKMTVVDGILPIYLCDFIVRDIERDIENGTARLVEHRENEMKPEFLDEGGQYYHYLYKGDDVRRSFPELMGLYYGLVPIVSAIVAAPVVTSPHPDSDVNIKYYPSGGGTIGWHFDTNGITVLVYLTSNDEGALHIEVKRYKPDQQRKFKEQRKHHCSAGEVLIMDGRKVKHRSEPVITEAKAVAVLNYYQGGELGDTWRPDGFDDYVYKGVVN